MIHSLGPHNVRRVVFVLYDEFLRFLSAASHARRAGSVLDHDEESAIVTFAFAFIRATALMLALAFPLFLTTYRRNLTQTTRRFLLSAAGIGTVIGFLAFSSERIVQQCEAAGNSACVDFGAPGLVLLAIVGYVTVAWARAWVHARY